MNENSFFQVFKKVFFKYFITIFSYHVNKLQVMLKCLLSDGTQRPPVDNITSPIGISLWPPFFTASHYFVVWDLVNKTASIVALLRCFVLWLSNERLLPPTRMTLLG